MTTERVVPAPALPSLRTLCTMAELSANAIELLKDSMAPREFIQLLVDRSRQPAAPSLEMEADAVRLLAHALPVREAIWWAWVSVRRVAGESPTPAMATSLAAAETWIAKPTDENRRAALRQAQEDNGATPGGLVALAAGLSGGSLAPPDLPEVPTPPWSAAKAIAGAVIIAAVQEPADAPEVYRAFVNQGCDVADRVKLWERFPAQVARS